MSTPYFINYVDNLPFNVTIKGVRSTQTKTAPLRTIIFFASKNETFQLGKNYKTFQRKLKNIFDAKIYRLKSELSEEMLPFSQIVFLPGIKSPLTTNEILLLRNYVENGGSVVVLCEENPNTNIYNSFTEHFGIAVYKDSVIRSVFHKYTHPKECLIQNALICSISGTLPEEIQNINILYSFGCTLDVFKPALPLISSGSTSYPVGRPLGALYQSPNSNGKLIVLGSGHVFTDKYIEKEDNKILLDFLLNLIKTNLKLETNEVDDSELTDYVYCSNVVHGAMQVRGCLQDCDELLLPGCVNNMGAVEPMRLVDKELYGKSNILLPDVLKAYDEINVKKSKLTLIKPVFEAPFPPPCLAVFPPFFKDLPPPPLEFFDLDEEFMSPQKRLGLQTKKCTEDDLDTYVKSIGQICEVPVTEEEKNDSKSILHVMLKDMCTIKSIDRNDESDVEQNEPLQSTSEDDNNILSSTSEGFVSN